jgi:hypothetical protein
MPWPDEIETGWPEADLHLLVWQATNPGAAIEMLAQARFSQLLARAIASYESAIMRRGADVHRDDPGSELGKRRRG